MNQNLKTWKIASLSLLQKMRAYALKRIPRMWVGSHLIKRSWRWALHLISNLSRSRDRDGIIPADIASLDQRVCLAGNIFYTTPKEKNDPKWVTGPEITGVTLATGTGCKEVSSFLVSKILGDTSPLLSFCLSAFPTQDLRGGATTETCRSEAATKSEGQACCLKPWRVIQPPQWAQHPAKKDYSLSLRFSGTCLARFWTFLRLSPLLFSPMSPF